MPLGATSMNAHRRHAVVTCHPAVVVNAQSQESRGSVADAPLFLERRSRPRHGTIKLIEDVVYRAMREEARTQALGSVPQFEPPPTLVLYSQRPSPIFAKIMLLRAMLKAPVMRAFPVAACKFFCLVRGKQLAILMK
jgi:hypothetical protein